jgi:hypothetical protein
LLDGCAGVGLGPSARWNLDEMVVRIAGEPMYPWRTVDHEGKVLDMPKRKFPGWDAHREISAKAQP